MMTSVQTPVTSSKWARFIKPWSSRHSQTPKDSKNTNELLSAPPFYFAAPNKSSSRIKKVKWALTAEKVTLSDGQLTRRQRSPTASSPSSTTRDSASVFTESGETSADDFSLPSAESFTLLVSGKSSSFEQPECSRSSVSSTFTGISSSVSSSYHWTRQSHSPSDTEDATLSPLNEAGEVEVQLPSIDNETVEEQINWPRKRLLSRCEICRQKQFLHLATEMRSRKAVEFFSGCRSVHATGLFTSTSYVPLPVLFALVPVARLEFCLPTRHSDDATPTIEEFRALAVKRITLMNKREIARKFASHPEASHQQLSLMKKHCVVLEMRKTENYPTRKPPMSLTLSNRKTVRDDETRSASSPSSSSTTSQADSEMDASSHPEFAFFFSTREQRRYFVQIIILLQLFWDDGCEAAAEIVVEKD